MTDPLGFIGSSSPLDGSSAPLAGRGPAQAAGPGFKELLEQQIDKVNELQKDAKEAIEDLASGRRRDVESVMIATVKADTAFRILLQVRNKVMDAYEELKQMRV